MQHRIDSDRSLHDLGYESASAFITMFKKIMGQPPGRYLSTRQSTRSDNDAARRDPVKDKFMLAMAARKG